MKSLSLLAATLLGLTLAASAAPAAAPAAPAKPAAKVEAAPKADKPMPMNHKVDTIDEAAKTFTYTTEKGTKVVNKITATTVIQQGDKPAQFSDIKPGDVVSGLHIKKSDTEYEIVKITKFGPKAPKAEKEAKTATPAPKVK